jgi:hypothetical protein
MTPLRRILSRVKRLDRIAGEMNVWLLVVAIGLGVLDLAVMAALHLPVPVDNPTTASADRGPFNNPPGIAPSVADFGR